VKRSLLITGVIALHFVLALLWLCVSIYLLWLTRSPATRQGSDSTAAVLGLEIAAAVLAPPALLGLIGAYGLKANKLWGWWLALLVDAALFLVFAYSMVDDGWRNIDTDMVAFTAASLVPVILLLLPAVRRHYWRKPD
jgi:uncharacterized membrane protein (DUF2068 family)